MEKKTNWALIGLIVLIAGILMFTIYECTTTVTGYKGANGQYYSDPSIPETGPFLWMSPVGVICMIVGGFMFLLNKKDKNEK